MGKLLIIAILLITYVVAGSYNTKCNQSKNGAKEGLRTYILAYEEKDNAGMKDSVDDFLYWNRKIIVSCNDIDSNLARKMRKLVKKDSLSLLSINSASLSQEQATQNMIEAREIKLRSESYVSRCRSVSILAAQFDLLFTIPRKEQPISKKQQLAAYKELLATYKNFRDDYLNNYKSIRKYCTKDKVQKAKELKSKYEVMISEARKILDIGVKR